MALPPRRAPLAACLLAMRACGFVPGGVVNAPHVRVPPAVSKTAPKVVPALISEPPPQPQLLPLTTIERLNVAPQVPRIPDRVEPFLPYLERPMQAQPIVPPLSEGMPSKPSSDDPMAPYFFPDLPRVPSGPGTGAPKEGEPGGGLPPDFAVRLPSVPIKASKVLSSWAALPVANANGAGKMFELMKKDLGSANPDNVFALTTKITGADVEAIGNTVSFEYYDDATGQKKKVVNIGYIGVKPTQKEVNLEVGPELFRRITYWAIASGREIIFTTATDEAREYYRSIGFDVAAPDSMGRSQVLFRDAKDPKAQKDARMVELELDSAKPFAGITAGQG